MLGKLADHLIFDSFIIIIMITTKLKKLDEIITNGVNGGTITDIFGYRGTGKTQMALEFSINLLKSGKNVLFIDTTGEFRPERLVEIIKNRNLDDLLLNRLQIARVTNTEEQIELITKIQKEGPPRIIWKPDGIGSYSLTLPDLEPVQNLITRAYDHLKTLPKFDGATDC